jgi:thiosulfate/3-mercaptopyruvate sulfurtransferase
MSKVTLPSSLVSIEWLQLNLAAENLVILDASVPPVVPGFVQINSPESFLAIPGARRFDYDQKVCMPNSSLPHMLPGPELFQEEVRKLGINQDSIIVVYDDVGLYASPRAWWMFRAMRHQQVAVLDGGLPAWIDSNLATRDQLDDRPLSGNFTANLDTELFCDFNVVLTATDDCNCTIMDARSAGRFYAREPEPRPGMRGGHMPNAKSLPFPNVLDNGAMKPLEELKPLFESLTEPENKLIFSCGSGLTACVLALAAHLAGYENLSVYDGSWSEWGVPGHLPVVSD